MHAGKHQNYGETDVFPADQQQQRPNSDLRVGQPIGTIDAEVGQNLIDGALLLQQQAPSCADDDLGNDIRHEDEGADETTPLELLVQQQCEQDGERSLDDQRADHDLEGMQNCRLERGILKRCDVVLETNEFTCLGGKSVTLPLIEAVISTQDDRQNHKADEQKNRRCGQYENLNITTHFAIGRFLGPLSAQRHRVFACT